MEDDTTFWSDDEIEIANAAGSGCNDTHRTKSSSLPANGVRLLRQCSDNMTDGFATSASSGDIADVNGVNQLSSSVKSCNDASAFESFSCTDDDDDEDCDESDPDTTSIDSSNTNNR